MTETLVILDPIAPQRADQIRALLPPELRLTHGTTRGDDHLKDIIAEADYAIAGQVAVSADVLRAAKKLKLLHKWGVGVDNLDLDAARACGIKVARTTGSNAIPVAEFGLGLTLAALRCIGEGHAALKQGEWRGSTRAPRDSFMLTGKTVGIVGFGAIGQAFARILKGFNCRILYNKRTPLGPAEEAALGATFATLPDLLKESDVVSLNCPLTPETKGVIDGKAIALMKKTAVLVNIARGGVVVEPDLVEALRAGVIHAAAMDVFETEPLPPDSPLLGLDNLVVTPHLAAIAADNFAKSVYQMVDNIMRVSRGEPVAPHDSVV